MADPVPWIAAEAPGDTARLHAPATLRNRDAIADVLATMLPSSGTVLEVASGSGEHCAYFAQRFRALTWQPSDPDSAARASIAVWCDGLSNSYPAIDLDAENADWPLAEAVAVLCINMVHISPWQATVGLLVGAARLLRSGAPLFLYGPYRRAGRLSALSNDAFDTSLKMRDPRWGLRDLDKVVAAADGFVLDRVVEMPTNNLSIIFRRRDP
jgi:SAM-dependent methyltransferase